MNKLDISSWKEFKIAELFITETSKSKSKNKLQVPTGATIARKDLTDGDIPRITVTNLNNGIIGYYKNIQSDNYRVHENFISVSFLGTIFYHPYRASLDMKVHCLKLKEKSLDHYIALFLIGIIKKQISYFAYNDQLSSSILPELSILLPVKNNQPDWEYMESYAKGIYSREKEAASLLLQIM
ncbi:restriction endonuclease subunit S [Campylobacter concisus]|uniref:restriction endonuclease subunit S n=1 Tax=Campylobacter concisus TaxID=199 RepID=UPI000CD8D283|nr:restriction endonuclease subunit S [Campylobacter concisus]